MNKKTTAIEVVQELKMRLDALEDVLTILQHETLENTESIRKWLNIDKKFKEALVSHIGTKKD